MHQQSAVGKAVKLDDRGNDGFWLEAKIVDPLAIRKCEEEVYTGLSVGVKKGRIFKGAGAPPGGRIVGGDVIEVSLVDYPCNENSNLEGMFKAAVVDAAGEARLMAASSLVPLTDEEEALKLMVDSMAKSAESYADGEPVLDAQAIVDAVNASVPAVDTSKGAASPDAGAEGETADAGADQDANQDHIAKVAAAIAASVLDTDGEWADGEELAEVLDTYKAAEADLFKRDFSAKERRSAAKSGAAMPDGSFPIHNEEDLQNAVRLVGHSKNPAAAKKHIIARAKALGLTNALPEGWTSGSPSVQDKAAQGYILKRAHDLLCPAHDGAEVLLAYPELVKTPVLSMAVDPEIICQGVWDMLCGEVQEDGGSGKCAEDIKDIASAFFHLNEFLDSEAGEGESEPEIMGASYFMAAVADIRKSFVAEHPEIEHIAPSAPSPDQFNAEALADVDPIQRPVIDRRAPNRTFYSHEKRDELLERLKGVHEALGGVLDCPVVTEVAPPTETTADPNAADPASTTADADKAAALTEADLEKAAKTAAETVKAALTQELAKRDDEIAQLRADIEKMAAEPDPRRAPSRRAVTTPPATEHADLNKAATADAIRRWTEWHQANDDVEAKVYASQQLLELRKAA